MRAILLAAGLGTRLRPLTNTIPKCLVSIKGQPLLGIWLERLTKAGMGPFLVNTHHLSDKVFSFIHASSFRDQVDIINEQLLLGTAGTLIDNLDFFKGQDGMLIHADNYCLEDISAFIYSHLNRPSECLITMMIFESDTPSSCGIVELDKRGVVIGFHEKVVNPPGNLANGAVYILSAKFLNWLANNNQNYKDFSTEVLPQLVGRIYTHQTSDIFIDIGSPLSYEKANLI
jgi:mannose-1-phosphate guanylyltransferase